MIALPFAHDSPPLRGRLRVAPEDFQVREMITFPLTARGTRLAMGAEMRR